MDILRRYTPPPRFRTTWSLLALLVFLWGRNSPDAQVTGGNQRVVVGHTAILPCKMTENTESLTQISWRMATRKRPENNYFFTISEQNGPSFVIEDARITFIGNFEKRDGTLQISNVTLDDEGNYSCVFTLFPSGISQKNIPLQILVPPSTSLNNNSHILGNEEVLLATCTAAGARPPAEVKWLNLGKDFKERTNSTQHANGTTTTVLSLFGVLTREIDGLEVQCVVSSPALLEEQRRSLILHVFFPPMNVTIVERPDQTIECVSEGNPKPSFTWTRFGKTLPHSHVKVDGGSLTIARCASQVKGLYQCEVSNPYGQKNQPIYLTGCSGPDPTPWILFGLLLSLNVIGAAWYFYKNRCPKRANDEPHRVPSRPNSPEMVAVNRKEPELSFSEADMSPL